MKRVLLVMMLLGAPLGAGAQETSAPAAEVLLLRLLDGLNNTDFDAVISLFADDVLFWGTSTTTLGTDISAAETYFAALRDQQPGRNVASAVDFSVLQVSENFQLLSGTWKIDMNGGASTLHLRTSLAAARRDGQWKIVQFHNSALPQ